MAIRIEGRSGTFVAIALAATLLLWPALGMAIPSGPGSLNHVNTLCLAKRACEFRREYRSTLLRSVTDVMWSHERSPHRLPVPHQAASSEGLPGSHPTQSIQTWPEQPDLGGTPQNQRHLDRLDISWDQRMGRRNLRHVDKLAERRADGEGWN